MKIADAGVSSLKTHRYRSIFLNYAALIHMVTLEFSSFSKYSMTGFSMYSQYRFLNNIFGAMSYNFYFISGRNPACTVQALQQVPKAAPEPRPRPVLQLIDHPQRPEIAPLTEANVQARTPDPRPRNREILSQRAASVRDEASIRDRRSHRSRSHSSRSPGRESTQVTQVTGQISFHPPPPPIESPPGQWDRNLPGVWNQYGNQCYHQHEL